MPSRGSYYRKEDRYAFLASSMMMGRPAFLRSASFMVMIRSTWSHLGQVPLHPSPDEVHSSSVNGMSF